MKLTLRVIDALNCPAGRKDRLVFDDEQAGLGVRVTASGGKTYLAQYTVGGRKRRVPLGSCSAISLAAARDAVRAILGDVAKGRDPAAERRERARTTRERVEQDKLTLDVLIARWEQGRLSDRRQGYRAEATRALRYAFAKQLTTPASELDAKTIRRIVNAVSEAGKKATAKLMVAYGRACYSWAVERDLLVANPFDGIKADSVQARDRVLTDVELGKIWQATGGPGSYGASSGC